MAIQWTTTDRASAAHGVKVAVHGDSGVGKTVLCSTAPRPVILSAEAGLLSLAGVSIPTMLIRTVDDITEAHRWLTTSADAWAFDTICLDSASEIAETVLTHLKGQVKDPRQAYGEMQEKMTMLIRTFRDIVGKHVYFAFKQERMKDEDGVVKYGTSMPGQKLGPQVPYFFDEVFALRIGKTTTGQLFRYLQTQPDLQYIAKDRSGKLAMMEPPDLNAAFRKIQGV